jgi:hypothetical protein
MTEEPAHIDGFRRWLLADNRMDSQYLLPATQVQVEEDG